MYSLSERMNIRRCYGSVYADLVRGIRISPYDIGFKIKFSPIEARVWESIRFLGIPLYPEFPIGHYFADFADPQRKIAIEVDSVKWHSDKKKDIEREKTIRNFGWEIYRIPSRMVFKVKDDFYDDEGKLSDESWEKFLYETAEGLLIRIYKA